METMLQRSDSTNFGGAGGGQRRSRRRRCLLLSCSCEAFRRPQKLCLMFWRTCAESEGHTSQAVSRLPWKHHLSALLHVFFFTCSYCEGSGRTGEEHTGVTGCCALSLQLIGSQVGRSAGGR